MSYLKQKVLSLGLLYFLLLQYYILPSFSLNQDHNYKASRKQSKKEQNKKQKDFDINDFKVEDLGEGTFSFEGGEDEEMDFTMFNSPTEDIEDSDYIANDPLLMQDLMNGIKRDKKYNQYFAQPSSPRKDEFYDTYLKKKRKLTSNTFPISIDTNCPESELYAKVWQISAGYSASQHKIYVQDLQIRDSDRAVFFTGIYATPINTAIKNCFFLRMNYLGTYEYGSLIWHNLNTNAVYTECKALTLTEDNKVVATGNYYNARDPANAAKHSALIVLTKDDFTSQTIKIWSASTTYPQYNYGTYANDVAVTADGSIFVTGYTNGWSNGNNDDGVTNGNNDCFVLKLDYQLERVYAKTFGTNLEEQCQSIQVTRNFDYIYIGGSQQYNGAQWQLFFLKMDGYAEKVYYSYYVQPLNSKSLVMKRIILRNPRDAIAAYTYPTPSSYTLGNADTNNLVYFCATYTDTITYFSFGTLSSSMVLLSMFSYGDPSNNGVANNVMGDCDITNDGRFMVGTMGTGGNVQTGLDIDIDYQIQIYSQYAAPFNCYSCFDAFGVLTCCTSCTCYTPASDYSGMLNAGQWTYIRDQCQLDLSKEIQTYVRQYNSAAYSWHTCSAYYTFNYNDIHCYIDFDFSACPADSCCGVGCSTTSFETFENNNQPWYFKYAASWNGDQQFMDEGFEAICTTTFLSYYEWESYWFCAENTAAWTDGEWDDFDMVFEQDCLTETQYSDFFIFKIDMSSISHLTAWVDNSPVNAVYFGESDGSEYPYAIGVDEWGYIVVAGTTNSVNFGVPTNTLSMLYIKTHWDLNYELDAGEANVNTATPVGQVSSLSYLKRRFITPKKFKNTGNSIVFMRDMLASACTGAGGNTYIFCGTLTQSYGYTNYAERYSNWIPMAVNEDCDIITYDGTGHNYRYEKYSATAGTSFYSSYQHDYGQGQSSITLPYTYYITKGKNFNDQLPLLCLDSTRYYERKTYEYHFGTGSYALSGVSIQNYTSGYSFYSSIGGPPYAYATSATTGVTASQGIYYQDKYLVGLRTVYNYCGSSSAAAVTPVQCARPYTYYDYMDDANYTSLRRFNYAVRLKYIVDDSTLSAPSIVKDIPAQTLTAGIGYSSGYVYTLNLQPITNYFTGCIYLKAKQVPDTSQSDYRSSTQLPYWIVFYEFNQTFLMYPPDTLTTANPVVQLELICCDNLDECVSNTFSVTCTNTAPDTVDLTTTSYILQYDSLSSNGQHFTFARTSTEFIDDLDTNYATYTTTDTYSHQAQSHSVLLSYTASYFWNGGNKAFGSIDYIGEIYGEPVSTGTFGLQTITFSYFDEFSTTAQSASFTIYVNQQPIATTTGTGYSLGLIDPFSVNTQDNIFTQRFPWLKTSGTTSILDVDTSLWFTDPDTTDTLTYSCTYSDGTNRQNWIGYSTTNGLMKSNMIEYVPSEYMNLKITATDPYGGSYSYYKTMTVDTQPQPNVAFVIIYCSVGKSCAYDFSDTFTDPNGDYLIYDMPSSTQIATLLASGFEFSAVTQIVSGKGSKTQVLPLNMITATDPYGLYNSIYFTIIVTETKPQVRGSPYAKLPDQTITEGYLYYISLPNNIVYDPNGGTALLLYASTPTKTDLPSWINFNPMSQSLSGKGPSPSPQSQQVMITYMNSKTSDTEMMLFTIYVIPNKNPVTNVMYLNQDYVIYQDTFFEASLPKMVYSDFETNRFPSITCTGSNGQAMPGWLVFNEMNRTVYGFSNVSGNYGVDFTFTDDAGKKTYSNIMIKVLPLASDTRSLNAHYILLIWGMVGLMIYMSYAYHFHLTLFTKQLTQKNEDKKFAKETKKRFQEYQDVEIMYVMPEFMDSSNQMASEPVITNDSDFLGIDRIRKWRARQQKLKAKMRKKK